ncbi:cytidine deaminase [Proteiniphilum sp. UBA5384]|uniref:cytidine deaminase n=1 Tax=Proteiniphilum sp. UBA5384 TaxID=1947279 RepID=UPI0025DEC383|nr:cytidine deaminase [Proteiniphilum sp. UBA5384]
MKEINLTTKIAVYPLEECSETEKKLIEAAKQSTKKAYAPYSGFKVGAAVLLENGEIISANNQENAAYPSGLCAERTAVFFANASHPDQCIMAIAVAAWHNGRFTDDVITPCGGCRQVLLETENRFNAPMKILMYGNESVYILESAKDLLPLSFGDGMLK